MNEWEFPKSYNNSHNNNDCNNHSTRDNTNNNKIINPVHFTYFTRSLVYILCMYVSMHHIRLVYWYSFKCTFGCRYPFPSIQSIHLHDKQNLCHHHSTRLAHVMLHVKRRQHTGKEWYYGWVSDNLACIHTSKRHVSLILFTSHYHIIIFRDLHVSAL